MASANQDPPPTTNGGISSSETAPTSSFSFSNQSNSFTTINIPISTKLTKQNFLTWKSQLLPIIHGYNLYQFLNSSAPHPSVLNAAGQVQLNPDYLPWVRQDHLLLGWMRSSLTEQVQAQVIACSTSAELWSTLQKQFSATSRARLIELKRQLQTATKGSSSCSEFLDRIRQIADELAFIGAPMSDDDLSLAVLNGLGTDFNPFFAAIQATTRRDPLSFDDLHGMLLSFESLVMAQQTPAMASTPTALFSSASPSSNRSNSNQQKGRGSPFYQPRYNSSGPRPQQAQVQPNNGFKNTGPQFPPKVPQQGSQNKQNNQQSQSLCQICKKPGHSAKNCRFRYAEDANYRPNSSTYQAYMAQPSSVPSSSDWILDSGATHHVTNDINNFSSFFNYNGGDNLQIGDGSGLNIDNIGPPHQDGSS
ncbi:Copia-like polyprotein/retrotransposon [Rhynchospora pubera]|uniref:Copia-like polyprotein/retrotransposon n=1 Tax=Rhynchospora pubera TaxID=906938 RepID=A0AAV8BP47_9POAL|nr:Copia-like polyprotein/retrotransposon [Rhynchospora pubera]